MGPSTRPPDHARPWSGCDKRRLLRMFLCSVCHYWVLVPRGAALPSPGIRRSSATPRLRAAGRCSWRHCEMMISHDVRSRAHVFVRPIPSRLATSSARMRHVARPRPLNRSDHERSRRIWGDRPDAVCFRRARHGQDVSRPGNCAEAKGPFPVGRIEFSPISTVTNARSRT